MTKPKYFKGDTVIGNADAVGYYYTTVGTEWTVVEQLEGRIDNLRLIRPEDWDAYWQSVEKGLKEHADPAYTYTVSSYNFDLVKRNFTSNKEAKSLLINFQDG